MKLHVEIQYPEGYVVAPEWFLSFRLESLTRELKTRKTRLKVGDSGTFTINDDDESTTVGKWEVQP